MDLEEGKTEIWPGQLAQRRHWSWYQAYFISSPLERHLKWVNQWWESICLPPSLPMALRRKWLSFVYHHVPNLQGTDCLAQSRHPVNASWLTSPSLCWPQQSLCWPQQSLCMYVSSKWNKISEGTRNRIQMYFEFENKCKRALNIITVCRAL